MGWVTIVSILGALSGLIAIAGLVYNLGRMNAKIEILWDAYKEEARAATGRRGTMESSSQWQLSKLGLDMISPELRDDMKSLIHKKQNPSKLETWKIIKLLGGVPRLSMEAEKADVPLSEFIVMVEVYFQKHLGE